MNIKELYAKLSTANKDMLKGAGYMIVIYIAFNVIAYFV